MSDVNRTCKLRQIPKLNVASYSFIVSYFRNSSVQQRARQFRKFRVSLGDNFEVRTGCNKIVLFHGMTKVKGRPITDALSRFCTPFIRIKVSWFMTAFPDEEKYEK